jgi:putative aldouronate transport system permease protein
VSTRLRRRSGIRRNRSAAGLKRNGFCRPLKSTGFNVIIYLAALSAIPQELYEAAMTDGAGRWRQLWHVTLPGLATTIVVLLLMRLGHLLEVGYESIILMYNPAIYDTADVINTYVYRRGILNSDYSFVSAVGLFQSLRQYFFEWATGIPKQ